MYVVDGVFIFTSLRYQQRYEDQGLALLTNGSLMMCPIRCERLVQDVMHLWNQTVSCVLSNRNLWRGALFTCWELLVKWFSPFSFLYLCSSCSSNRVVRAHGLLINSRSCCGSIIRVERERARRRHGNRDDSIRRLRHQRTSCYRLPREWLHCNNFGQRERQYGIL